MNILIPILSIWVIAAVAWAVRGEVPFRVCPICTGVSGTWLWMLAALYMGYPVNLALLAMLMGGSVVGIAYQAEKKLPTGRPPLLWKTIFIPIGFLTALEILSFEWLSASVGIAALLATSFFFFRKTAQPNMANPRADEIEKKLEDCC